MSGDTPQRLKRRDDPVRTARLRSIGTPLLRSGLRDTRHLPDVNLPALLSHPRRAALVLADGTAFEGFCGLDGEAQGEVVFNTSMTGYQEMATDPSYRGQILVLTTPHVGIVGANPDDDESAAISVAGLVVADLSLSASSWRARGGILDRLAGAGAPLGWGFDTRAIVLHVRRSGSLPAVLVCGGDLDRSRLLQRAALARTTEGCDLVKLVSPEASSQWSGLPWSAPGATPRRAADGPHVAVIDCGAKRSILRELAGAGARVTVVPSSIRLKALLALGADGIVVSNGPGDPAAIEDVVETLRAAAGQLPLLGICLGHQLLCRALGARTYRLPFGHHGANHPVRNERTGEVWITSQNHNYAVDPGSLPSGIRVTLSHLADGSVEGIEAEELGVEGVQFHPEAGPGPHDAHVVFARFVRRCKREGGHGALR